MNESTLYGRVVGRYNDIEVALIVTTMGVFSLISIFGNVMVFVAFLKVKVLRHPTNYFILSLALADVFVATFVVSIHTMYMLIGWQYSTLSYDVCLIWLCADYRVFQVSGFGILLVAGDTYLSIKYPIRYRIKRTASRVKKIIAANWITSFIIWVPLILSFGFDTSTKSELTRKSECDVGSASVVSATVISCFISYIFPAFVIFYLVVESTRVLLGMSTSSMKFKLKLPKIPRLPPRAVSPVFTDVSNNVYDVTTKGVSNMMKCVENEPTSSGNSGSMHMNKKTSLVFKTKLVKTSLVSNTRLTKKSLVPNTRLAVNDVNERMCNRSCVDLENHTRAVKLQGIHSNHLLGATEQNQLARSLSMPSLNLSMPSLNLSMPSLNLSMPSLNLSMPSLNLNIIHSAIERRYSHDDILNEKNKEKPKNEMSVRQTFSRNLGEYRWMATFNVLLGASFVINIVPFAVIAIARSICLHVQHACVSRDWWLFGYCMCYLNITLNPIWYAFGNKNFNRAFKVLLCGQKSVSIAHPSTVTSTKSLGHVRK